VITRRDALALLAAAPAAAARTLCAQAPSGRCVVSAGLDTFLIEADGTVKGWSLAEPFGWRFGLGHANRVPKYTAVTVPGLRDVVAMAASVNTAYALLSNGTIMAWGGNARGELGATPLAEVEVSAAGRATALSPLPVLTVTGAIAIAAGDYHALAVTRAGQVFVWGYNLYDQLGVEMPIIRFKTHTPAAMQYLPFPLPVPGLADVVAVAGGSQHSLALLRDGTVRAWGTNRSGQLGDGTTITRKTPVPVVGVRNAVAIAADGGISAALLADGRVMTWGDGNSALGRKAFTRDGPHPTPAFVDGVTGIRALALGSIHVVALTNTGTVISWGDNMIGEIGHPGASPRAIPGLTNVTSVEAYTGRTFAVLANGTIMALGQVPWWARVDGSDPTTAGWPIPLAIKNLNNPP
jgi:alpha-tubulin suppressor-like RCC1 family protein